MRRALATVPRAIRLYDRDGNEAADLFLQGTACTLDPGSAAIQVLDPRTGARRAALTPMSSELVRLVDGLPHFAVQVLDGAPGVRCPAPRWRTGTGSPRAAPWAEAGRDRHLRTDGFAPMREMLHAARNGASGLAAQLAVFNAAPAPRWPGATWPAQALLDCARAGIRRT